MGNQCTFLGELGRLTLAAQAETRAAVEVQAT